MGDCEPSAIEPEVTAQSIEECRQRFAKPAILALQSRGARPMEIAITMLVWVILVGFAVQFVLSDPSGTGMSASARPVGRPAGVLATRSPGGRAACWW